MPERIHLDREAAPRRHGLTIHDGVHPGQRSTGSVAGEKQVRPGADSEGGSLSVEIEDLADGPEQRRRFSRIPPGSSEPLDGEHEPEWRVDRAVVGCNAVLRIEVRKESASPP